jgi:hypothetical protein
MIASLVRVSEFEVGAQELWVYDFRTSQHFTLKTKQLSRGDLDDFVEKYQPGRRHERVEAENFKRWSYEEIVRPPGKKSSLSTQRGVIGSALSTISSSP